VDQITIEAARRGDREAQARLLRELQDPWFRFCLGLLGDPDDARDATQETALRFLRDLSKFRGESSLSTWSMGIAINVTRETRRKRRAVGTYDEDREPIAATPRVAQPPDEAALAVESRDLLRSTLKNLPERQREAVLLRYFQDLSLEQTADAMGCAVGTVKATVHQALRVLRNKLKQLT
jgi:RNA polymerase sigma-70 factor (ECF subfamily)